MTVEGQLGGKWKRVPDSTGALIPGMEARTVREDGTEADYNESGELWLKGRNVAMGYYRNPKATAETFVDGWVRTGDQFKITEEGYFYFQDRAKVSFIQSFICFWTYIYN
jgi:long-subunit acyl-CoA synthetase (AMP-forming)